MSEGARVNDYSDAEYWGERYGSNADNLAAKAPFEWYRIGLDRIWPFIAKNLTGIDAFRQRKVLEIGMGNSTLCQDLVSVHAFGDVVGIDYCAVSVEAAKTRAAGMKGLDFLTADARDMRDSFENDSVGLVIDKATIDAIACAGPADVQSYVGEVARVLVAGGLFVCITCSDVDGEKLQPLNDRCQRQGDPPNAAALFRVLDVAEVDRDGPASRNVIVLSRK